MPEISRFFGIIIRMYFNAVCLLWCSNGRRFTAPSFVRIGSSPALKSNFNVLLRWNNEERRMHRIVSVVPLPDFSLTIQFADGLVRRVNILTFIRGSFSQPLRNWDFFRQVAIDSSGGVCWPNGYDFCPNFLHDEAKETDSADQPG